MPAPKQILQILRRRGLASCAFRAQYALRKKLGLLRRKFPVRQWSQMCITEWLKPEYRNQLDTFLSSHPDNSVKFFFDAEDVLGLNKSYAEKAVCAGDEIVANRFQYFFDKFHCLGSDPDWFLIPVSGKRAAGDRHWCDVEFFDSTLGDIKFVWEPSRFAWAYTLVRAYSATGDEKYVEKFWFLLESWLNSNQPNLGPNYACGQECAIRLMAMSFAFHAFAGAAATSAQRQAKLALAIAFHAERIERNICFAISTRTNHSLTEAAGIYIAGLIFPEFQKALRWRKLGKKVLVAEGMKQIYPDGSYIQHSMNYHRLMLQVFLMAVRLGQLNGDVFPEEMMERLDRANAFLIQMLDGNSGRVPNYGPNDGALIVPLNSCGYLDYRPATSSMHFLLHGKRLYDKGPWDEDLLWLFGRDVFDRPVEPVRRTNNSFESGGYYTLVNGNCWAMMRCHSFKDRPGHSDTLHLDLWWKGINVFRDSGTYMYNCCEPYQSYFVSARAHNTLMVDGRDHMTRMPPFMWLDWVRSKMVKRAGFENGLINVMQGEHYGYSRNGGDIVHRRAVLLYDDVCVVVDDVTGSARHNVTLNWQLCGSDCIHNDRSTIVKTDLGDVRVEILTVADTGKCDFVKGDEVGANGLESLYYGSYTKSSVLVFEESVELPSRIVTVVNFGDTIRDVKLNPDDSVSWICGLSRRKSVIMLSSIEASEKYMFRYVQRDSKKIFLV